MGGNKTERRSGYRRGPKPPDFLTALMWANGDPNAMAAGSERAAAMGWSKLSDGLLCAAAGCWGNRAAVQLMAREKGLKWGRMYGWNDIAPDADLDEVLYTSVFQTRDGDWMVARPDSRERGFESELEALRAV